MSGTEYDQREEYEYMPDVQEEIVTCDELKYV